MLAIPGTGLRELPGRLINDWEVNEQLLTHSSVRSHSSWSGQRSAEIGLRPWGVQIKKAFSPYGISNRRLRAQRERITG